ncbi:hypothetical protein VMCG_02456 [Cytospora schulzeri]|uniref:Uncharacterized protein n=1 Tax=Cytospora schulzeri TaxID=448051 RepID=A0A423X1H3_9PEZI|nr:hypothetical protein VMCG_02456 [Valsa malicola]
MGFLKIFTRRPGKDRSKSHNTQLGPGTPLQGTRPAPDCRAEALDTVKSLHERSHRPRKSSAQSDYFEMRSRTPGISRRRGRISEDRPGTAASNHSATQDWFQSPARPRREPRRPPISFKKPSSSASLSTAYSSSAQVDDRGNEDGLAGIRGRNSSISSVGSTRFKDVLDAQEAIRPTDFRSRLQATGARDYGEDVADRNMVQIGKRDNHAVLSPRPANKRSKSLNSASYFSHFKQAYMKGQMFGSVVRETSSMNEVEEVNSISRRNKQRLSLNTYIPSGMASPISPRSANTSPGLPGITETKDFALPNGRPASAGRSHNPSPTVGNFSFPKSSKGPQRTVLEWREFLSRYGYGDDVDDKLDEGRVPDNRPRNEETLVDTKATSDDVDGADGRAQSRFSQRHSTVSNSSEDQRGFHRPKSIGLLSSPLEADEQVPERPSSTHNGSTSEASKSESTGSSNVYSMNSDRPHSRHTASTSLDSTQAFSIRKSEENSISVSKGQPATSSSWSPETLSTAFNIDDYVSSDDESFTTARKRTRPSAEGEEDLLFKPGYGITGVALPGLEEIEEDTVYPTHHYRSSRSSSVSSDGSAAIAAGPVDNRFSMARDIPMPLRQVRSDPEMELYGGTFGRSSMRNYFRDSEMSASAGEERGMPFAAGFDDYFLPLSITTTANSENGVHDDVLASNLRLSALGHPQDGDVGTDSGAVNSAAEMIREKGRVDIATAIRIRKEEKARKRAEGLRHSREKRMTRTSGEMETGEMARLKGQLDDDER